MNTYTLVGYQDLNFKTNDGSIIDGVNIFVVGDFSQGAQGAVGHKSDKKFINRNTLMAMKVNLSDFLDKRIYIFCDLKGNVVMIQNATK